MPTRRSRAFCAWKSSSSKRTVLASFFFQAEDGIRDHGVTGVQTCALPIWAPLVSEHVAFVRGGGLEAGHLLPVPRTREALAVLVANVRLAQAELGVPLALEHVAALLEWPAPELDEAAFLTELLERTGALLLLDLANTYANARNHGGDL